MLCEWCILQPLTQRAKKQPSTATEHLLQTVHFHDGLHRLSGHTAHAAKTRFCMILPRISFHSFGTSLFSTSHARTVTHLFHTQLFYVYPCCTQPFHEHPFNIRLFHTHTHPTSSPQATSLSYTHFHPQPFLTQLLSSTIITFACTSFSRPATLSNIYSFSHATLLRCCFHTQLFD